MASPLNTGQTNVGGTSNKSYGNQSPAVDAVPLAWLAGDHRYYMGLDPTIVGWVCTVSGTPGTWVQITTTGGVPAIRVPILSVTFNLQQLVLAGPNFGAPATPDWFHTTEGSGIYNFYTVPNMGPSVSAPDRLSLAVYLQRNAPTANVVNGLVIRIINPALATVAAGAATGSINANPAAVGPFLLLDNIPIADVATGTGVGLEMTVNGAAAPVDFIGSFQLVLSGHSQ